MCISNGHVAQSIFNLENYFRLRMVQDHKVRMVQDHDHKPGGGTRIIFWRGVRPEVWNPYPYLRIFLPQKTADLKLFFEIFANRSPFLRVFLPQNGWFYHFFAIFAKWDPLLRIFLIKMGPMSKDFSKVTHLGGTSPYALTCEYPPPRDHKSRPKSPKS